MQFKLLPCIDQMIDFYQKPKSAARFQDYLSLMLDNNKEEVELPIMIFNPMAKPHVSQKLEQLKAKDAEEIAQGCIQAVTEELHHFPQLDLNRTIQVCLVLADDLKGGWTNRYTTAYANTFTLKGIIDRNFCTPVFWSSEDYSEDIIRERVTNYIWRTIYQVLHLQPITLGEHIQQEAFVQQNNGLAPTLPSHGDKLLELFREHQHRETHNILISFLYGDKAAEELGHTPLGVPLFGGMQAAAWLMDN